MKVTMKKIKIASWTVLALLSCGIFVTSLAKISQIFYVNAAGADELKDSTIVGPDYDVDNWNCYAFAIGYEHPENKSGIAHGGSIQTLLP